MSKIDYLGLDGHTLTTFLTVLQEASVSKAAIRLNVSQSAVSHTLDKLRVTFDDPLFVRSGRGIAPTARAISLHEPITSILGELKSLTYERDFDPHNEIIEFTIATNDFPMRLIFPKLLKNLYSQNIKTKFHFIPSGVPSANLSRTSRCHILITPAPPKDKNIFKTKLLQSKMACFYDAEARKPPKTWQQFVDSKYADVKFSDTESSIMVLPSVDTSSLKPPTITVPNFSSLPDFIKGTNLITTQLEIMSLGVLKKLDFVPLPKNTKTLNLFMAWHKSDDEDPAHLWLRQQIIETVNLTILDTK